MDGEKLNKEGLKKVWLKFWSLLKVIVGDVDVEGKGDLQTQVNSIEKNLPDVVSKTKNGLVPQLPNENTTAKYLRQDGTWATPPDNNTTYGEATQSTNGLMTAVDKKKLDGIDENANAYTYTHPLTHSASMIEQDAERRFVSDTEKNAWNNKLNKADVTRSTAVNIEGQKALDAIEKNATVPGTMAYDLAQVNSKLNTIVEVGWIHESGDDFNNYVKEGRYTVSQTHINNILNMPPDIAPIGYCMLIVFCSDPYIVQLCISDGSEGGYFYYRLYAGFWRPWRRATT